MKYLITGHTGFKGSWLSLLLKDQGHEVSGIALDPVYESIFNQAEVSKVLSHDFRLDIRSKAQFRDAVHRVNPDVIIHLAAQPLVRYSYKFPVETFETNVIGTLNLLEATKELSNLRATLIITTDKVYKNFNHLRGYVETDELGGEDPYSASKAAADIATQSWVASFATSPVAIARAGNVIGGGDWAEDRLIPDLVRAYDSGVTPVIRNPLAVRPWQHVLDCLNGYLMLIDNMIETNHSGEWNFGPDHSIHYNVSKVIETFGAKYGVANTWEQDSTANPSEAGYLLLDSSKARRILSWRDLLTFDDAISWTAEWYQNLEKQGGLAISMQQIDAYRHLIDAAN